MPVLVAGDEVLRRVGARSSPGSTAACPRSSGSTRTARAARSRGIERWLDEGLGPDGRLLDVPRDAAGPARDAALGAGRRAALGAALLRRFGWALGPDRASLPRRRRRAPRAPRSRASDGVFDEIAARLADGRRYLSGDRFTAADLTFGALSAPCSSRRGYGSPLPPPERAAARRWPPRSARLREHPAGRFAARLYDEERRPAATGVRPVPSG